MSDPASPKPTPTGGDSASSEPGGPAPGVAARAAAAKTEAAAPEAAREAPKGAGPAVARPAVPSSPRPGSSGPAAAGPASVVRGAEPPASRGAGAVLTALAVALLAGGLGWVWHQQQQTAETMVVPAEVAALREQVRVLQQRLVQLEQRPVAGPAPAVDLRPLEGRIAALEQRPAAAGAPDAGLADRMAALDRRLAQAEQAAGQARQEAAQAQQAAASRLARIARLQVAAVALEAGRALGEIPGAPPALARFAATPPPSEAGLRLAFPEAARQARAASRDEAEAAGIGDRVWQRVRSLVTVKEGESVLLGSPAATSLGRAGERLEAGDLAGSVAALEGLDAGAAAAMAPWRREAEALLAARAALAKMAAE